MAVTADKVVVELEAQLAGYNADVAAAVRAFQGGMGLITESAKNAERSTNQFGVALGGLFGNVRSTLGGLGNSFKPLTDGLKASSNGLNLNRNQMLELGHVARSLFDTVASGGNIFRGLAQEGGRLAEVFGTGKGGAGGIATALKGVVSFIGPAGLAAAGFVAAIGGVAIASHNAEVETLKLQNAVSYLGNTSGISEKQLEVLAERAAKASDISVSSAREIATAYVTSGKISGESIAALTNLTSDYAAATNQKIGPATKELRTDFSNLKNGVDDLENQFHFLNATQIENVKRLIDQGDEAGAAKIVTDALTDSIGGAAKKTDGWSSSLRELRRILDGVTNSIGKLFSQDLEQKISSAQARVDFITNQRLRGLDGGRVSQAEKNARSDLSGLIAERDQNTSRTNTAQANKNSVDLADRIKSVDPKDDAIDKLSDGITGLRADLKKYDADPSKFPGVNRADIVRGIAGGEKRLAKLQRGPGGITGAEQYSNSDAAIAQATKAELEARKAITFDLATLLKIKTDEIEAERQSANEAVESKFLHKQITKSARDSAIALNNKAATEKTQAAEAASDLENERQLTAQQNAVNAINQQTLAIQAGLANTLEERFKIERFALARRQAQEARDLELEIKANKSLSASGAAELRSSKAELFKSQNDQLADSQDKEAAARIGAQQQAIGAYYQQTAGILASLAKTTGERYALEKAALERRQKEENDQLELEIKQKDLTSVEATERRSGLRDVHEAEMKQLEAGAKTAIREGVMGGLNAAIRGGWPGLIQYMADSLRQKLLDRVADALTDVIFNAFKSAGQSGPGGGSQIGAFISSIFKIPGFAGGTNYAPGGMAIVGENGPELVNLRRGAQVFPAEQTRAMLSGGTSGSAPTNVFDLRGAVVTDDLLRQMDRIASGRANQAAARVFNVANKGTPARLRAYQALGT